MIRKINNYFKKKEKKHIINQKRKNIYDYLLENIFFNPNFEKIKSIDIYNTFKVFDKILFDNDLIEFINNNEIIGEFIVDDTINDFNDNRFGKIIHTKSKSKSLFNKNFKFVVSSEILKKISYDFIVTKMKKRVGGIMCCNTLECFIILFEHELIHLLILFGDLIEKNSHGKNFKKLIKNMFNHTETFHYLFLNNIDIDVENIDKKIKCISKFLKENDLIQTIKSNETNNKIIEGFVVNVKKDNAVIVTKDNQILIIKIFLIDKINNKKIDFIY